MPRTLKLERPIEDETRDRRAFLAWLRDRPMKEAAEILNRSPSWMSMWVRHQVQVRDHEVEHWSTSTGIGRRTFLEGRFDSRQRFKGSAVA